MINSTENTKKPTTSSRKSVNHDQGLASLVYRYARSKILALRHEEPPISMLAHARILLLSLQDTQGKRETARISIRM